MREVAVDANRGEADALGLEDLQQQVLRRPEGLLGERRGAETVLVADHHQLIASVGQALERRDQVGHEAKLLD